MLRLSNIAAWVVAMLVTMPLQAEPTAAPAVGVTLAHTMKLLGGMLAVLAMIAACAWALKRLPIVRSQRNGALKVLESVSLGTRERMLLVDVDGTRLLIGVGAAGMACLHVLGARAPSTNADFGLHMQQSMQAQAAPDDAAGPILPQVSA